MGHGVSGITVTSHTTSSTCPGSVALKLAFCKKAVSKSQIVSRYHCFLFPLVCWRDSSSLHLPSPGLRQGSQVAGQWVGSRCMIPTKAEKFGGGGCRGTGGYRRDSLGRGSADSRRSTTLPCTLMATDLFQLQSFLTNTTNVCHTNVLFQ